MRQWKNTLYVGDFYQDEALTIPQKASKMAQAIEQPLVPLFLGGSLFLDELGADFKQLGESNPEEKGEGVLTEQFDDLMEALYNWSDNDKQCWVETWPRPQKKDE